MEKLTLGELIGLNPNYQHNFVVTGKELEIARKYIEIVDWRHRHILSPQVGDMVCGSYYGGKHSYDCGVICSLENGVAEVCYNPYVPFVHNNSYVPFAHYDPYVPFLNAEFPNISLSVSGGPFTHSHICMFEKVEEDVVRSFKDWGRFGPGASQAFDFPVVVRKWRLTEPISLTHDVWGDNTITYDIEGSAFFDRVEVAFNCQFGDTIKVRRKDGSWFEAEYLGKSTKATMEYLEWREKGGKYET